MRERDIEKYLADSMVELGGVCWKWNGFLGVPDRICIVPGGEVVFVELKKAGGRLSKIQLHRHNTLRKLGARVEVLWSKTDVDDFICTLL